MIKIKSRIKGKNNLLLFRRISLMNFYAEFMKFKSLQKRDIVLWDKSC